MAFICFKNVEKVKIHLRIMKNHEESFKYFGDFKLFFKHIFYQNVNKNIIILVFMKVSSSKQNIRSNK
jgi:hypothetical protein